MSQEKQEQKPTEKKTSRKETIKEVIEIALFLGLAILLVFSFNWILAAALHTDTPLVVVTSESMEPTYYGSNRGNFGGTNDIRKDMLIVRGVAPSEIKAGDTIVFYRQNLTDPTELDYESEPIVHRVNRVYQDNVTGEYWFTTKGDNPDTNDEFVTGGGINELTIHQSRVIGKVVGRIPYLGGIISYFKTPTGRIVLFVIIGVILLGTWVFSSFGGKKEKEKDIFSEEEEEEKDKSLEEKASAEDKTFYDRLKSFYRKTAKHKNILIPALILTIIVFIPIVDTLAADWNAPFGIENVVFDGAKQYTLHDADYLFLFADVYLSCPGHWHQQLRFFELQISNTTTGEILGANNWSVVYNFEGTKRVSSGAWIDPADVTIGENYTITVTAFLSTKFGKTWTDVFTTTFLLVLR
ncbi:MAG: signal peptidase I [Candidatus Heimdallarchaeota archaeon]|nr:MAG: signal peptidase I [Candidatus Heimdallarchaeota archaeon]RLI70416.1 MAG: signal peptidase I [Candidatus Gerdarchaeota archaeon]